MIYKIRYLLKSLFNRKDHKDDFNWKIYSQHYKGELATAEKKHSLILKEGDYEFKHHKLLKISDRPSLHPNHKLIYETILDLNPSSIIEIGCGGGDHLHNLKILGKKNTRIEGIDISKAQLSFLRQRHPDLKDQVEELDITLPLPSGYPSYDVAFTQAVLMHIKTGNSHLVALANAFFLAKKQVVLMEHWKRHSFMKDIETLLSKRIIPWKKVYYYYREPEGLEVPPVMIISAVPLKGYKKLSRYSTLTNYIP